MNCKEKLSFSTELTLLFFFWYRLKWIMEGFSKLPSLDGMPWESQQSFHVSVKLHSSVKVVLSKKCEDWHLALSFLSIIIWQLSVCSYCADLAAYLQFWPAVPQSPWAFHTHCPSCTSKMYHEVVAVSLQSKVNSLLHCWETIPFWQNGKKGMT